LCEKRSQQLYKSEDQFTVLGKFKGKDLKGKKYVPLFQYFAKEAEKGAFTVLADGYVSDDSGTGVVHCAPAFGEDDYRVCLAAGIIQKGDGIFTRINNY
jgi:isoleucyl-tRNA synthetase